MKFNPFCCVQISVQKALKLTGWLQIVNGSLFIFIASILLISNAVSETEQSSEIVDGDNIEVVDEGNSFFEALFPIIALSFYGLGMGMLLLSGATQRSHRKCLIWMIGIVVETLVYFILSCIMFSSISRGEASFENVDGYLFQIGVNLYLLVIVYAFLDELTSDITTAAGVSV